MEWLFILAIATIPFAILLLGAPRTTRRRGAAPVSADTNWITMSGPFSGSDSGSSASGDAGAADCGSSGADCGGGGGGGGCD